MHWAALMDQPQIQLELWHYGADETLADNDGDTPLVRFISEIPITLLYP